MVSDGADFPIASSLEGSRRLLGPQAAGLLREVANNPGLSCDALRRTLGWGWGTFYVHFSRLTNGGHVRAKRDGRRVRIFPTALHHLVLDTEALAVLRAPGAQEIAKAIVADPGSDVSALSTRLGLAIRCTYGHVKRLVEAGLVISSAPYGYRNLAPTPRLLAVFGEVAKEQGPRAALPGPP